MKLKTHLSIFIFVCFILAVGFTACEDDSSYFSNSPDQNSNTVNANKNDASQNADLARLEFPKVKGGTSDVITHSTEEFGINYSIEWDHRLRAQRWTCYTMAPSNSTVKWKRDNWKSTVWGGDPFQFDPKVPISEQPSVKGEFSGSYYPGGGWGSYYDRGHICASQDRMCSQEVNEQTFYMTNMMPQVNVFNAGIWAKMEIQVRKWNINRFRDVLYVCKGGTIDKESQILSYTRSGFIVPRFFFMAVLCKEGNQYKALGFWVEHLNTDHSDDSLSDYVVNIDHLEELTDIDFFCNLPDDIEKQVESTSRTKILEDWNF